MGNAYPSIIAVLDYLIGYVFFGIIYWLLNGVLVDLRVVSVTDYVYDFANYVWAATVVLYIIFGTFWLIRKIKEIEYYSK